MLLSLCRRWDRGPWADTVDAGVYRYACANLCLGIFPLQFCFVFAVAVGGRCSAAFAFKACMCSALAGIRSEVGIRNACPIDQGGSQVLLVSWVLPVALWAGGAACALLCWCVSDRVYCGDFRVSI